MHGKFQKVVSKHVLGQNPFVAQTLDWKGIGQCVIQYWRVGDSEVPSPITLYMFLVFTVNKTEKGHTYTQEERKEGKKRKGKKRKEKKKRKAKLGVTGL